MATYQDCWSCHKDGKERAVNWLKSLKVGDELLHPPRNVDLHQTKPNGDDFQIVSIKSIHSFHSHDDFVIVSYPEETSRWDTKLPLKYAFAVRPIHPIKINNNDSGSLNIPICRYFTSTTGCRYGSQCRYKHETKGKLPNVNIENKSNFIDDIDDKIKSLKSNIGESYFNNKTMQKYHDFYRPLQLDYDAMTVLTESERMHIAEIWKIEGNKMYSNKQYMDAIKYYQKAIILLDCNYFQNKNSFINNNNNHNDLLYKILSNTSQCWLSYGESVKHKQSEKDKYILYLLSALNNTQMSLWINNSISNFKALYRKIVCFYRLGLIEYADILIQQLRNLKNDKMIDLMIEKLQKKEKFNNNNKAAEIQKYSKLLEKLGITSELDEIMDDDDNNAWNVFNLQYILLSVSELVRTQKWSISHCILWLKKYVKDMIDSSMYYELLPKDIYDKKEYDEFRSYCFIFIMIVLSIKPGEIGKYLHEYVGYKSEDEWEYFSNEIKYLQMNNKFIWFCEQFWSQIVENVMNIKKYDDDIKDAIRKKILRYIDINNSDKRHLKWKMYYEQHEKNKNKNRKNILPSDGRLNKLRKYDFNKGNSMELGQDDLLNIHALASSRKKVKVIEEIEHVMPYSLYYMGFTWIHQFAKYGCYNAVEFVISMGMDVNVIDRVKYGGNRQYWYSKPVTAIDYVIKQLVEHHIYFANTREQKQRLAITVMTLRKFGGKRYSELKGIKGDDKETKIFQKIMSGAKGYDINESEDDDDDDDDEEYGYGVIPKYMCDELLCQGIKPWDDDAMDALSVLYDF